MTQGRGAPAGLDRATAAAEPTTRASRTYEAGWHGPLGPIRGVGRARRDATLSTPGAPGDIAIGRKLSRGHRFAAMCPPPNASRGKRHNSGTISELYRHGPLGPGAPGIARKNNPPSPGGIVGLFRAAATQAERTTLAKNAGSRQLWGAGDRERRRSTRPELSGVCPGGRERVAARAGAPRPQHCQLRRSLPFPRSSGRLTFGARSTHRAAPTTSSRSGWQSPAVRVALRPGICRASATCVRERLSLSAPAATGTPPAPCLPTPPAATARQPNRSVRPAPAAALRMRWSSWRRYASRQAGSNRTLR